MTFWTPEAIETDRYRLRATQAGCVGIPGRYAMMGGVTSAAAITAMEQATGKQLLWSTSQFVSHAPADTDFDIEVSVLKTGGRTTQARATLRDGDRVVLITSAALGDWNGDESVQYCEPMAWQAPESCRIKDSAGLGVTGDLFDQFERRIAAQSDDEAFESLWFRPRERFTTSSGLLAVLGDFLPGATSMTRGSSSVDNTLRVHNLENSEWFLAETRLQAVHGRLYQGTMNLFSETGGLLAVASQTGIRPS